MKAAVLTGLRQIEIRNVPDPVLERDTDVLVRMRAVGVCGSDVHNYAEGGIGAARVVYPFILGHEAAGVVEAVGAAVQRVRPGDRVAVEPALPCWACDQCRAGRWNTCRKIQFASAAGQPPGFLCERAVLPERNCIPVPELLTLEEAAFAEPLSIGVYAVQQSVPMRGARVGILGAGPIGLSVLLAARARGARRIYVTDTIDARLAAARAAGAHWTGNPGREEIVAAVKTREPLELDVVFECCGKEAAIEQGILLLKPGGRLMILGIPEVDRIAVPCHVMRQRELTLVNVRRQRDCVEAALQLIAERKADAAPLITHRYPLDRAREAFETAAGYRDGVVKAMIVM